MPALPPTLPVGGPQLQGIQEEKFMFLLREQQTTMAHMEELLRSTTDQLQELQHAFLQQRQEIRQLATARGAPAQEPATAVVEADGLAVSAATSLLQELRSEREAIVETLACVKQEKCEVISAMHSFHMDKEAAFKDLSELHTSACKEFSSLQALTAVQPQALRHHSPEPRAAEGGGDGRQVPAVAASVQAPVWQPQGAAPAELLVSNVRSASPAPMVVAQAVSQQPGSVTMAPAVSLTPLVQARAVASSTRTNAPNGLHRGYSQGSLPVMAFREASDITLIRELSGAAPATNSNAVVRNVVSPIKSCSQPPQSPGLPARQPPQSPSVPASLSLTHVQRAPCSPTRGARGVPAPLPARIPTVQSMHASSFSSLPGPLLRAESMSVQLPVQSQVATRHAEGLTPSKRVATVLVPGGAAAQ